MAIGLVAELKATQRCTNDYLNSHENYHCCQSTDDVFLKYYLSIMENFSIPLLDNHLWNLCGFHLRLPRPFLNSV